MVGCFLIGPVLDRFDGLVVITIEVLVQGVAIGLAPFCPHLIGYQILSAVAMFCSFGLLTGLSHYDIMIYYDQWRSDDTRGPLGLGKGLFRTTHLVQYANMSRA